MAKLTDVRVVIVVNGKETVVNARFTKKMFKRYKALALDGIVEQALTAESCAIYKQNEEVKTQTHSPETSLSR